MRFNVYLGIRVTVEEPSGNPQYAIDQAKDRFLTEPGQDNVTAMSVEPGHTDEDHPSRYGTPEGGC